MIMNMGDPLYTPLAGGRAPFNQGLAVNSFGLSPQAVVGSTAFTGNSTGTITLSAPAPMGGATFNLSADQPAAAQVPASVMVAAGSSKATFPVTTATVTQWTFVKFTASGPVTLNNTLAVYPLLSGVSLSQSTVSGGQTITGTISLNDRAPAGGAVVSLNSSNTSVATVPATATVQAGANFVNFSIPTSVVTASTPTTISATYAGLTVTAILTAVPAIASVDLNPSSTMPAGSFPVFEVNLAVAAPPGGALITITNGNPAVATVASSITIPAGSTYGSATVAVSSSAGSGAMDQITASYAGDAKSVTLTVQ
jgi:hypothetical protein